MTDYSNHYFETVEDIENYVEQLRNKLKRYHGSVTDVIKLLNIYGIRVQLAYLEDGVSSYMVSNSETDDSVIIVDANMDRAHQRLVLALELGKYLFEGKNKKHYEHVRFENEEVNEEKQKRSECFATTFLVPKEEFQYYCQTLEYMNYSEDEMLENLADYFEVPKEIIRQRQDYLKQSEDAHVIVKTRG